MKVKVYRILKNISQKQMAKELGITPQYLRLIEVGKVDIRRTLMIKISSLLEIPVEELFF